MAYWGTDQGIVREIPDSRGNPNAELEDPEMGAFNVKR